MIRDATMIEPLEQRMLLTAIVNGIFTGTNTIYDGSPYFEYRQADGTFARISVSGNLTAEFIGARVPIASFATVIRDLVPATQTEGDGVNLFSIYIVRSDLNTIISIATVPALTAPFRPMSPFTGNAGAIQIADSSTGAPVTLDLGGNTGGIFIGARTTGFMLAEANNIPIITPSDGRRSFGLRPSSAGQMFSGLEIAAGNDLGRFLLGGTITGLVDMQGSCQLFYAGNILTGDTDGLPALSSSGIRDNFFVAGDLENLVVGQSIGTVSLTRLPRPGAPSLADIQYKSGTQITVRGRLGQIKTLSDFIGELEVRHDKNVRGTGLAQVEVEFRGPVIPAMSDATYFDPVFGPGGAHLGDKAPNPNYNNDNFDSAQYLGTLFSSELRESNIIQLRGFINGAPGINDQVDFYAVALLAGQTIDIQLLESFAGIGLFDPDGRLVATDYSNVAGNRINQRFRYTADRPGAYRIAIANRGDVNFNGIADAGENISRLFPDPYELRVRNVGDMALGAVIVEQHLATNDVSRRGINVLSGDLGAIRTGTLNNGTIFSFSAPWNIDGSLRSIEAVSLGILETNTYTVDSGPDFLVRLGSIGLLRTTGSDIANSILTINELYTNPFADITQIDPSLAVGQDIQLVEAGTNLEGNLLANRSIGVIRAENVSTFNSAPVWAVNVDRIGDDGRIDLIDVFSATAGRGNLGDLADGGPAIATGPNGNVRYIRVSGTAFRDRFFGGGLPEPTLFQPGETARLVDDNGTAVNITPIPLVPAVDPVTGLPTFGFVSPGIISVETYGIRDKAGSAIINVTAFNNTRSTGSPGRGVEITSGARGRGGSVEIGEVIVRSQGTNFNFNEFTRTFTAEATIGTAQGQPANVELRGASPVDVFSIVCRDPTTAAALSGLTAVLNSTSGEIVNVLARHIGTIEGETVGLARQSTAAAVNGGAILTNAFPFNQQRNLVAATGDAAGSHIPNIRARRGVGNVLAIGSIGTINANADRKNVAGVHEGINAPVFAAQPGTPIADAGNIISVIIGEGILPSGTGNLSFAGLYADGIIDSVRNTGPGSDIRGDIVASARTVRIIGATQSTPNFTIGDIRLSGGSIIDADILTVTSLGDSREFIGAIVIPSQPDTLTNPDFDIRSIQLSGAGGIIGSKFAAEDIGLITVAGGFGVLGSTVDSLGDSVIDGIVADGYGIRRTRIEGGANINNIIARGTGKRLDTTFFSSSVRQSEGSSGFDAFSGLTLDAFNDLHKFLGTSATTPKIKGISDSGLIEDDIISGSRELGLVEGHRIIGRNVITTDPVTRKKVRIPFGATAYPMRISFANRIRKIVVRDIVDGLSLQAGGLDLFNSAGDVLNTQIRSAGRIRNISAGALRGTTSVAADGPEGAIENITTKRSLYATIEASVDIGTITIGTDLGSPLVRTGRNLNTLRVNGSILTGARVSVNRTLSNLIIGGDIQQGARVEADAIQNQQIGGQVLGDIVIT